MKLKHIVAILALMVLGSVSKAASFTAGLGELVFVAYHYDRCPLDGNGIAQGPDASDHYGSEWIDDYQTLSLYDSWMEVVSGPGYSQYYEWVLVIDTETRMSLWESFEETVQTVTGEWGPPESEYYVDELVHQNRAVTKLVKRGERYDGYERNVSEGWEDDWEFRTVYGTKPRP